MKKYITSSNSKTYVHDRRLGVEGKKKMLGQDSNKEGEAGSRRRDAVRERECC